MLIRQHFQNCNIALPRSTEFFIAPWKSYFPGLKNPIKVSFKMVMKIFEKQSIPRFLKMTQSQLYPSSLSSLFLPFILAFGKKCLFSSLPFPHFFFLYYIFLCSFCLNYNAKPISFVYHISFFAHSVVAISN